MITGSKKLMISKTFTLQDTISVAVSWFCFTVSAKHVATPALGFVLEPEIQVVSARSGT